MESRNKGGESSECSGTLTVVKTKRIAGVDLGGSGLLRDAAGAKKIDTHFLLKSTATVDQP